MDSVSLMRCVLVALLLGVLPAARADTVAAGYQVGGASGGYGATPAAACAAYLELILAPEGSTAYIYSGSPDEGKCIIDRPAGGGRYFADMPVRACPPGSGGLLDGMCTVTGTPTCASRVAGLNAAGGSIGTSVVTVTPPLSACYDGCAVGGSIAGSSANGTWLSGPFSDLGTACGGTSVETAPTLKPGHCPGSVNGTPVPGGVPCSNTSAAGPSSGSAASSASSPSGAVPGTSSSSSVTTCTGAGSCVTTTTTVTHGSDGTSKTGTESTTEPKDSFCAKNPGNPQCKEKESTIGGSCSAVTCTGDAVQCAIAREQQRRNCELLDANDASARGIAAAAAGDTPGDHPRNSVNSVALGSFDQTNIISGTCPADLSVPVTGGQVVSIPFSQLCGPAAILGNILVAITALSCIAIVFVRGS